MSAIWKVRLTSSLLVITIVLIGLGGMPVVAAGATAASTPSLAGAAETPPAAPAHAGGEASLVLPDLSQARFLGLDGRTLLLFGLIIVVATQSKHRPDNGR